MTEINNIKTFDYIYGITDKKNNKKLIKEKFNNKYNGYIEFIEDNEGLFGNIDHLISKTLGEHIEIDKFPNLSLSGKREYLNYKYKQIKNSIDLNGEININEIKEILKEINNPSKKAEIIDYCMNNNLFKYDSSFKILADSGIVGVVLDRLQLSPYFILNDNDSEIKNETSIYYNINNGINNGEMRQINNSIINDNELIELVLQKIDAIRTEGVDPKIIEEIENACKEKNTNKVIGFLKDITSGTFSSLIATGILMQFGIVL